MNVTQHMADQNARQPSKTKSDVKKLGSKGLSKNEHFQNPYSLSSNKVVFWYCNSPIISSINNVSVKFPFTGLQMRTEIQPPRSKNARVHHKYF